MSRPTRVTHAELDVLHSLWADGASTIRELTGRLYPGGGVAHYATVQKLLERLRSKGCVRRHPRGRGHVYAAAVGRDELIDRGLRETADRLCGGSLTPLLTTLVERSELSGEELAELRRLVDRLAPAADSDADPATERDPPDDAPHDGGGTAGGDR